MLVETCVYVRAGPYITVVVHKIPFRFPHFHWVLVRLAAWSELSLRHVSADVCIYIHEGPKITVVQKVPIGFYAFTGRGLRVMIHSSHCTVW